MHKPFVNLDELAFDDVEDNGFYTSRRARFSAAIGARQLGYNLTELPPGKAQCPFHSHRAEEEMFLILEGEGELRFGDQRYPLRKHDVVACPTGGAEVAHQIINTGSAILHMLLNLVLTGSLVLLGYALSRRLLGFFLTTPHVLEMAQTLLHRGTARRRRWRIWRYRP